MHIKHTLHPRPACGGHAAAAVIPAVAAFFARFTQSVAQRGALCVALACCAVPGAASAAATVLYDPGLGALPSQQAWLPLVLGGAATQSVVSGAYTLDTTGATVGVWGNGRLSPQPLDTQAGFELRFALQLLTENHSSSNRSGYSVLVVGSDPTRALELAFWADRIWAYDYDTQQADRFVHGVEAAFDTTAALSSFTLLVRQQQYSLSVGGVPLLSGALHDYSAGGAPYTVADFLFFGDDSSRGSSASRLGAVTISTVPEPASVALVLAALLLLAGCRRRWSNV